MNDHSYQDDLPRPSRRTTSLQDHSLPQWLQRASADDRQYYFDAEQALTDKEQALDKLLGEIKSLRAFAQFHARELVRILTGEVVNPEQIFVRTRHTFFVGKQKVAQSNRLTLPEFMLNGLQDASSVPWEVTLEGDELPTGITGEDLVHVMSNASMRVLYAQRFEKKYAEDAVLEALHALLACRLALSSFCAKLQGHLSEENFRIVSRASQGADDSSMGALVFADARNALAQMMVFCGSEGEQGTCILYAPHAPGDRDWYEFASIRQMNFHLFDWTTQAQGRGYLSRQTYSSEREQIDAFMRHIQELPSSWRDVRRSLWSDEGDGVLRQAVLLQVGWLRSNLEAVIPAGYRSATEEQRQLFTRLNTELKGLTRLASREAALISYEQFTYQLVKQRVEQVSAQHGPSVTVDPDRIMIRLDASREMTLSQLIISEHHITEDSGSVRYPDIYPSLYVLADHPVMFDGLIHYVRGWSKTLRPGEKYIAMLKSDYLAEGASGYALKRDVYVNLQRHEMHRCALAELFSGQLSSNQYELIEKLIEQLHQSEVRGPFSQEQPDSPQRNGVYTFYLQDRRIDGVYVFRIIVDGAATDFLYTPASPDGRSFRLLSEFASSVKVGGLGCYYSKRAKYTEQKIVSEYIEKVRLQSIEAVPMLRFDSRVRNFYQCYRDGIMQIIDCVDAKTTSLAEIVGKLVYETAVAAVAIVAIPFAPIGLGLSAIVMTKALFEGVEALLQGDYRKLFSSYLDCMLELATMRIGKLGFSMAQKAIARQLENVNTCMGVITACTGKTVDLAVVTELLKQAHAEPDPSEQTILL